MKEKPLYGIDYTLVLEEHTDHQTIKILSGEYSGAIIEMCGCSFKEVDAYAELNLDCKVLTYPTGYEDENILEDEDLKQLLGDIVMECLERYCEK